MTTQIEQLNSGFVPSFSVLVANLDDARISLIADAYGYVYQTDCSCGKLYIGLSKNTSTNSIFGYLGSGSRLKAHRAKHPDHTLRKTILATCSDYGSLERTEIALILRAVEIHGSSIVLNRKLYAQGSQCAECESFGSHLSSCSLVEADYACSECGGQRYHHFKRCSSYNQLTVTCEECDSKSLRHRKGCSKWKTKDPCRHCGSTAKFHLDSCVLKVQKKICDECGTRNIGAHLKSCSLYVVRSGCSECKSKNIGTHLKSCSQWMAPKSCEECGSQRRHRKTCSKFPRSLDSNSIS